MNLIPSFPPPAGVEFVLATGHLGDGKRASEPVNLLGRCKVCRKGFRVSGALRGYAGQDARGFTKLVYQVDGAMGLAHCGSWWDGVAVDCPVCAAAGKKSPIGQPVRLVIKPVLGTFKAEKVCDGRCMGATGHVCECSCGGHNHGASHG